MVLIQFYIERGRFVTVGDERRVHQDVGDVIEYLHGLADPYRLDGLGAPRDFSKAVEKVAGWLGEDPAVFSCPGEMWLLYIGF